MTYYDPEIAPDPKEWLKLNTAERYRVVENYHVFLRIKMRKNHAYVHVFVEDQLASGVRTIIQAMSRLQIAGMCRHDALHAIGDVIYKHYNQREPPSSSQQQSELQLKLNAELDSLGMNRGA